MNLDFARLFTFDIPWLEIIVRGSLIYLGVFVILRVILKREIGSVGISDLLMFTLISDAVQNGMAGEYHSITSGLLLVLTLVFWNYLLDWMSYRFEWFEHLIQARPLCLIKKGRLMHHNLRAASMNHSDLMAMLRKEGIEKVKDVKAAYLEGDGCFSVLKK